MTDPKHENKPVCIFDPRDHAVVADVGRAMAMPPVTQSMTRTFLAQPGFQSGACALGGCRIAHRPGAPDLAQQGVRIAEAESQLDYVLSASV